MASKAIWALSVILCLSVASVNSSDLDDPALLYSAGVLRPVAVPASLFRPREARTLVNTFPFNQRDGHNNNHAHAHGHDHAHQDHAHVEHAHAHHGEEDYVPLGHESRLSRQDNSSSEANPDLGSVAAAGERCVEKVMMVEETEYDEGIECHHSYEKRCHTTYTTDYDPQQEEECDENFIKNCYIDYRQVASDEPVQICNERLVRNCDKPGPEVCETVYESECETSFHVHELEEDVPNCVTMQVEKCEDVTEGYTTSQKCDKWPKQVCTLDKKAVKKHSPETQCRKKPREVCGPGPCPVEPGPQECRQETRTIVQEVPEENCDLTPEKVCKFVTKLVPSLKPKENCVDIPKEVCTRSRRNPRKVNKPVIKKWCYIPTEESGLAPPPPPKPTTTAAPKPTTTTTPRPTTEAIESEEDSKAEGQKTTTTTTPKPTTTTTPKTTTTTTPRTTTTTTRTTTTTTTPRPTTTTTRKPVTTPSLLYDAPAAPGATSDGYAGALPKAG